MKHTLLLTITFMLFMCSAFSQSVVWEEIFLTTQDEWTLEGNWTYDPGRLWMNWSPETPNYDMAAISPVITLPSEAEELIVNQYLYMYETSTDIAEISIITGSGENVLWHYECGQEGDWGSADGTDISFSVTEYAGQDVQIKFRTWGPTTYSWWWWDVYRISVTAMFDNDMLAVEVGGPNNINEGQQGSWTVKVKNVGLNEQSDYTVKLFSHLTGEEIGSVDATSSLAAGSEEEFSINWTPGEYHNTCLYGQVIMDNDALSTNNNTSSYFVRVEPDISYQVLVWDNDNGSTNTETGLTDALDVAGIQYTKVYSLPADLSSYNMIFASCG